MANPPSPSRHCPSVASVASAALALFVGCAPAVADAAPPDAAAVSNALEGLAQRVAPGVVHIVARGYVTRRQGAAGMVGSVSSTGSGFVVSPDGWIVTNAHVVFGSDRVLVAVNPPPKSAGAKPTQLQLPARVVGVDLDSDIAVLKVEAKGLRALELADSNAVRPGQLVLAFGSPLGLQGSVSMGMVGAVDRQPDPDSPMVYIQTDAAINPGNSGGPLINADGQVIGINTFIVSTTGGNQGLGFAVPSDIAASVYAQIRDEGSVWHGTIGINAQTINPVLITDLGLARSSGALIADVLPGGPAADADLQVDDIVVGFGGDQIESARELNARIHSTRPGRVLALQVVRDGEDIEVAVQVAATPGDPTALLGKLDPKQNTVESLGAVCVSLTLSIKANLLGVRSETGVLVLDTAEEPAFADALQPGDVIVATGRRATPDLATLRRELFSYRAGTVVVLRLERDGQFRYARVELQ